MSSTNNIFRRKRINRDDSHSRFSQGIHRWPTILTLFFSFTPSSRKSYNSNCYPSFFSLLPITGVEGQQLNQIRHGEQDEFNEFSFLSLTPTDDATIFQAQPFQHSPSSDSKSLLFSNDKESSLDSLIKFDISMIERDSYKKIDVAELKLRNILAEVTNGDVSPLMAEGIRISPTINSRWKESTVTWDSAPQGSSLIRAPFLRDESDTNSKSRDNNFWDVYDATTLIVVALVERHTSLSIRIESELDHMGVYASKEYKNGSFAPTLDITFKNERKSVFEEVVSTDTVIDGSCADKSGSLVKEWEHGGTYLGGSHVTNNRRIYKCKPYPYAGWCAEYMPGFGPWEDAWTDVGRCYSNASGGAKDQSDNTGPTKAETTTVDDSDRTPSGKNCAIEEYSSSKIYRGNDQVSYDGKAYSCKNSPQDAWCSLTGYEPGFGIYWAMAWDEKGPCKESAPTPVSEDSGISQNTAQATSPAPPCAPLHTPGYSYSSNDLVSYGQHNYACKVPEWCTLIHYSPGTEPYASLAWVKSQEKCNGEATRAPSVKPTEDPTSSPTNSPFDDWVSYEGLPKDIANVLQSAKPDIESKLLLRQTSSLGWAPSTIYDYDGLIKAIKVMNQYPVGPNVFYLGGDNDHAGYYGLVNIAAFLAQSMVESIKYDACDEASWNFVNNVYPLSNACGQGGLSYQDFYCPEEERHMECPVDPKMSTRAVTNAKWIGGADGAPGPLFCAPRSKKQPFTGIWDHLYRCNKPDAKPPEYCSDYAGQRAGRYDNSAPAFNAAGRYDVEGCCWWGRGAIQATGICNMGKLNYFLGARAAKDNRPSPYPSVDFCKDPEVICSSIEYKELKWVAGLYSWINKVQSYDTDEWSYLSELHKFVDGGMTDEKFIESVSGVLNKGCHDAPCETGKVDGAYERATNFKKVLGVLRINAKPMGKSAQAPPIVPASKPARPVPSALPKKDKVTDLANPLTSDNTISSTNRPTDKPRKKRTSPPSLAPIGHKISSTGRPSRSSNTNQGRKPTSGFEIGSVHNTDGDNDFMLLSAPTSDGPHDLETVADTVVEILGYKRNIIDDELLVINGVSGWEPSKLYRFDGFITGLHVMYEEGIGGQTFYMGDDGVNGHIYGLVNVAAFLAQSMVETIKHDSCDENNVEKSRGKYPLSNACGQNNQSYQDFHCSEEESHMECPINRRMKITAVTNAQGYGAPGPLYCHPRSKRRPFSGSWDQSYHCNRPWDDPPEKCDVYEGQKAGRYDNSEPYSNSSGRDDVEACCWWGRGVIRVTGICNIGKMNYYLGAGAAKDGRPSRYPDVDFCADPEVICASEEFKELKWIAGMYRWADDIQTYNQGGWNYLDELRKFVDGGLKNSSFIESISAILSLGCHSPPCAGSTETSVHEAWERKSNFLEALKLFDLTQW